MHFYLFSNALESVDETSKDDLIDTKHIIVRESKEIDEMARKVASACTEQGLKKVLLTLTP